MPSLGLFLGLVLFVRVQLDAEHGFLQFAAALRLQAGFIGLSGQIQGKPPLAQHSGNAGACGTHGGVGGFVGGLCRGQLCKAHLKQLAAVQIGLQRDVVVVALEQRFIGSQRCDGAHSDHSLFAVDAGASGGMLETAILGLPAGIGEPYFDSVESEIAHLVFSVPAVKGIEFGTGFGFAGMRGSEANDAFRMTPEGAVVTATNHNAGINGGIANGMPVVFRTVVKPTPSIYKQQDTVDYLAKKDAQLSIQGRHDPCIVPRAAIVQTCAAALAVGDLLTARYGAAWMTHPTSFRKEDE